jgi:NTP pyrophosphatase (non-canonical NTP hydrolase)
MNIKDACKEAHETSTLKGFWSEECKECKGTGTIVKVNLTENRNIESETLLCTGCKGRGRIPIDRNNGELIALMHSELSEALEVLRKDKNNTDKLSEELADCCIRIFDFCGGRNIDLEKAIKEKMNYNKTRPIKHNKLF